VSVGAMVNYANQFPFSNILYFLILLFFFFFCMKNTELGKNVWTLIYQVMET